MSDKQELIRAITKVVENYQKLDEAWNAALKVFDGSPENPLYRATWGVFDDYLDLVNELYDLDDDWLHWFIYENDCGENKMEAGFPDKLRPIVDVESFVDMLLELSDESD
jgi:hypothetical protein